MRRTHHKRRPQRSGYRPALRFECLEQRLPLADLNDSLSEAVGLGVVSTNPRTVDASIAPDTDVNIYRFTVSTGQVVDFDIDTAFNGPGGLGSFLRLFNSQGQQLATNNDANAPGENQVGFDAYLRFTFGSAGAYYLGVSNANNTQYNPTTGDGDTAGGQNATGNYQLIIQALPVDGDDSINEAPQLGGISTAPKTIDASITPDIDVDLYRFTVNAGQVVDFDIDTPLNGPGGLGSFLRVFNLQGQQLASNNDAAAPGENLVGFDAYLRFTFATGGTYFVGVSNANNTQYNASTGDGDTAGGQHSIGSYQLIVQTAPVPPVDTDDSISEASPLGAIAPTPASVSGAITPDVDVDLYSFAVTAGQIVDFDIDTTINGPGGLGSFLRLFNAQGQQLASNDDAIAPGETQLGFDAYLRFTFAAAGTFYIGVSNNNNQQYNPTTGAGDTSGGLNATGNYQLIVQALLVDADDSISEATPLGAVSTTAISVNADITPDLDVDLYSFTVSAGQVVDFDIDTPLNGPGGLGSFLRLFNAQGLQLAFNDNAIAPGENVVGFDAYLRFTFATAGTFFIGVSNANNLQYNPTTGAGDTAGGPNATGSYQLIVQTAPAAVVDVDDSISEALSLGVISTTPVSVSGAITPDVDVDMYSLAVSAGQTIDFDIDTSFNGPGGLGSFLRLFNAQGTELAFNDNAIAPGENVVGFDAYLRFTFVAAGTFYIGVSNANNTLYNAITGTGDAASSQNATGSYLLIAQALPVDTDDTLFEANDLGIISATPRVVDAAINPDIDVDVYSIAVGAGQTVDFDIDTTQNGPGGLGSFLRLFSGEFVNGQYVQLATNDDAAAPGESVVGFDAYLRFTFASGGVFYIAVSNANNRNYDSNTGANDTAGGLHSIGNYRLVVQTAPAANNDPNDSLAEAFSLGALSTTPTTLSASISPDTDVNIYQFSAAAGQVIDFDIDTTQNGPGGLGSYLRLFNAQGQQIGFSDDAAAPGEGTVGFDAYLRFTFATAGTYYVGISNSNNRQYDPLTGNGDTAGGQNATGSYQLIVQVVSADDPDDSLAEATSLGALSATARTIDAGITPDIDVDLYGFTVTGGQVVDFDIDTTQNGPGGLGSFIRVFNASGQQLAFNNDAAAPGESVVGFDAYLRFTFAAAGTYYVGVSNSNNTQYNATTGAGDTPGGASPTGNYRLIVQALAGDTDDTLPEAAFLGAASTTPVTVNAGISPDIDVDMYGFTVAAGQAVDFDIDTPLNGQGGLDSFVWLFNAQGQPVTFNSNGSAPGENQAVFDAYLRHTFATAGTYYLGVSNATNVSYNPLTGGGDTAGGPNSVGSYTLIVQAVPVVVVPTLTVTINVSSIPEANGSAVGTVARLNADVSQPLTVALDSSDTGEATVPGNVVIPGGQSSVTFAITAVNDQVVDGTKTVSITAAAGGFTGGSASLQVTDSNGSWHNAANPFDVNGDNNVSAADVLAVINHVNAFGSGPIPTTGSPPPFLDVNSDNSITSLDALLVINFLNAPPPTPAQAEGESPPSAANDSLASHDAFFTELGSPPKRSKSTRIGFL